MGETDKESCGNQWNLWFNLGLCGWALRLYGAKSRANLCALVVYNGAWTGF